MSRKCAGGHCSKRSVELNNFCKIIYKDAPNGYAGKPVASQDANGPCFCTCSCVALGTLINESKDSNKAVEEFRVGDDVLTSGANFVWEKHKVEFSDGTGPNSTQDDAIFVEHENGSLVVTGDHLFLLDSGKLRRADRLSTDVNLVDHSGNPSRVISVMKGYFEGGFHHIATSREDPKGSLDNHLILTAGVVSADYTIQVHDEQFLAADDENLPVVGSLKYNLKYNISPPTDSTEFDRQQSFAPVVDDDSAILADDITIIAGPGGFKRTNQTKTRQVKAGSFTESSRLRLRVPDGACSFIPDDEARQKSTLPHRTGVAALASQEEARGLVFHFHAHYPDVVYHIDNDDDTVNAYAWVANGVRHVAILGGLIRFPAIEWEAIALVLGHELAHHYGGPPTYSHGLSCEGQADYIGAGVTMRQVFFGNQYNAVMDRAIAQLGNFFGPRPAGWGCSHPSVACRTDIYQSAVRLDPIPNCAHATA